MQKIAHVSYINGMLRGNDIAKLHIVLKKKKYNSFTFHQTLNN